MNDKDCAERTLLLAPELDACARAAQAVEAAVAALENRDPDAGGRSPTTGLGTQDALLRQAMRRYEEARAVLDVRCRALGLDKGAASVERKQERLEREAAAHRQKVAAGRALKREPGGVSAATTEQRSWARGGRVFNMAVWNEDEE